VPEDLALEHRLGQGAAVQCYKLPLAPALGVERSRHHLFAGPGFTEDQHIHIGRRQGGNGALHLHHSLRPADDGYVLLLFQLFVQPADLIHESALFQRPADHIDQALRVERLFDEVVGVGTHGLDRHDNVTMAGDQDHRKVAVPFLQFFEQLQSRHVRQLYVGDNHCRGGIFQGGDCALGIPE